MTAAALLRYRIAAYVVGSVLLVLVFVAMPLKYVWDQPAAVQWVGQLHGFLFIGYLVLAFDFGVRARWPWWRIGIVLLAGTVPFLSFVTERWATREVQRSLLPS